MSPRPPITALVTALAALVAVAACSSGPDRTRRTSPRPPGSTSHPPPPPAHTLADQRWVSGANGNFPAEVNAWAAWTGRPVGVAIVFTDRSDWRNITTASWPVGAFNPAHFPGQLSVAQPLYPRSGDENACARGDYDGHWAQFGRTLTAFGRADAYVRLGWEFNGTWFWWHVRDPQAWRSCFQHAATAIRSTAPGVQIDWNVSAHRDHLPGSGADVWSAYPGDTYVDVVSIDSYDSYPASTTQQIWNRQCRLPAGICTVAAFARAHGKKFAVPEWGLVRSAGGGGDNPFYIEKMREFFSASADILAYEAYYNNAEPDNVLSALHNPNLNPNSSRRYLELFGKP